MDAIPLSAQSAILVALLALSGFFSMAETSMMAANRYRLRSAASLGSRGARLALTLLDQAAGLLDDAMGALDALQALGSMPELSDPTGPLTGILGDTAPAIGQLGSIGAGLRDLLE